MCRCGVTLRDSLPQTAGGWTDLALMRTPYPYSNAPLTFPLFPQWDSALVWHGAGRTHGAPLRHCCCQERGEIKEKDHSPQMFLPGGWESETQPVSQTSVSIERIPGYLLLTPVYTFPHSTERCGRTRTPAATPPNPKKLLTPVIKHIWPRFWSLLDPSASVMSHFLNLLNASLGLCRKYMWTCEPIIVFPLNICGASIM